MATTPMMEKAMELYKKHRPKRFEQMRGVTDSLKALWKKVEKGETPHALLLTGPSGCGKTTFARLLRRQLGCSEQDFREVNAASSRGIDMVREIQQQMNLAPLGGKSRIWCLDEAQLLTREAQSALLKTLEDTPRHVYFVLCTTERGKILRTILTRCTEAAVAALPDAELEELVGAVLAKEERSLPEEVMPYLLEAAGGSARKILVDLEKVLDCEEPEAMIAALEKDDMEKLADKLVKALVDTRSSWSTVQPLLKQLNEEPEAFRRRVLGYASAIALNGGKGAILNRAISVIYNFESHVFDSGKAGLIRACADVLKEK